MSRTAEHLRAMGILVENRETWELGRSVLVELERRLGNDLVAAVFGTWLGRHHRQRPRLMWSRPATTARAPHYLAFVRELPCARCGSGPCDPHHWGPRGVGQKTDDYRVVPLCRPCHLAAHRGEGMSYHEAVLTMLETLIRYLRVVEQT